MPKGKEKRNALPVPLTKEEYDLFDDFRYLKELEFGRSARLSMAMIFRYAMEKAIEQEKHLFKQYEKELEEYRKEREEQREEFAKLMAEVKRLRALSDEEFKQELEDFRENYKERREVFYKWLQYEKKPERYEILLKLKKEIEGEQA